MHAEERSIDGVLTEQRRYEIPSYQRPYAWTTEQTEDLLTDIEDAQQSGDKEYFIGSLITVDRGNGLFEVVDGQQRLTTLSVIFARLQNSIADAGAKQMLGDRVLPRNPLTGETATPRVTLRESDQPFYRMHVLNATPASASQRRAADAPKARLLDAIETVDRHLAAKTQEELKRFAHYILTSVFVVFVQTESRQSAFRLFSVLNDRGLGLSNADLIKAFLFAQAGAATTAQEDIEHAWSDLEDTVEIDRLDTFLGYHRATIRAERVRRSLSDEYEDLFQESGCNSTEFVQSLARSGRNYDALTSGDITDASAKRALTALNRVTYDEWIPPLLSFLNQPVAEMAIGEFAGLLERITMQNWVRRLGRTARNTIYYRLITSINRGDTAIQLREVFSQAANNSEFFSLLNGDVYGLPSAKAVLLRLEEGVTDLSVTKTYSGTITIEHVLPQSLKDPYWTARFPTNEHSNWLHKLGNLTLLSGKKNSAAQYYAFPKKKDVYLKKNQKVSFDLTKEVCAVDDWTVETVAARQARLLEIAVGLWTIA